MAGNTLGTLFCVTNFGESHGPAIGCVVDGCPPNLELSIDDIQKELNRRRPGTSRHVSARQEPDQVEILSGVWQNKTLGTPIALLIRNQDARSSDYDTLATAFRPGHADYTYWQKYGIRDHRGGGRASARLTAPAVAAGAIAKKWLRENHGVVIRAHLQQLGPIHLACSDWDAVEQNPFFSADPAQLVACETYLDQLRQHGDSCGALIRVVAEGVPVGWGAPLYRKLDADIAQAMMGINAVKAVSIGAGWGVVEQLGSVHVDGMEPTGFLSNRAGGVLGGISSGQMLEVSVAFKPTSSVQIPQPSVDQTNNAVTVSTSGRHDPCVGLRAPPIVEAMLALVLMDHALLHRGQQCPLI